MRYTSRNSNGSAELILKNAVECVEGDYQKWELSNSPTGTIKITGDAVDRFACLEEKQLPKEPRFIHMLGEYTAKFECPCGKKFNYDCRDTDVFFCSACGQALQMETLAEEEIL